MFLIVFQKNFFVKTDKFLEEHNFSQEEVKLGMENMVDVKKMLKIILQVILSILPLFQLSFYYELFDIIVFPFPHLCPYQHCNHKRSDIK